jgi:hypothetical protein
VMHFQGLMIEAGGLNKSNCDGAVETRRSCREVRRNVPRGTADSVNVAMMGRTSHVDNGMGDLGRARRRAMAGICGTIGSGQPESRGTLALRPAQEHCIPHYLIRQSLIMAARTASKVKSKLDLYSPDHQRGLQSLLSKVYSKPVELNIIKIRRPQLDADVLGSYVAQRLLDRKMGPRRVMRDAAYKSNLPTDRVVTELQQAKRQPGRMVSAGELQKNSAFGPLRPQTAAIIKQLNLSQVSSVKVQAAGRLSKRMTANRAQKKVVRRGANGKGPGYMMRGFQKGHVKKGFTAGRRRIGSFGVSVDVGHS